jgi:hypothetical protein
MGLKSLYENNQFSPPQFTVILMAKRLVGEAIISFNSK